MIWMMMIARANVAKPYLRANELCGRFEPRLAPNCCHSRLCP